MLLRSNVSERLPLLNISLHVPLTCLYISLMISQVSEHNSALFRKLTLFYLLANFSAPLYIAFMKIGGERLGCADPITAEQSYAELDDGEKYDQCTMSLSPCEMCSHLCVR